MRFWASRDMDGMCVVWAGDVPVFDVMRWHPDERAYFPSEPLFADGLNANYTEKTLLKAIFPIGIRRGQCREIELLRAVVKED